MRKLRSFGCKSSGDRFEKSLDRQSFSFVDRLSMALGFDSSGLLKHYDEALTYSGTCCDSHVLHDLVNNLGQLDILYLMLNVRAIFQVV